MRQNRRIFLGRVGVGAMGAAMCAPDAFSRQTISASSVASRDCSGLEQEVIDLFSDLPDRKAIKIWAPPTEHGPEVLIQLNGGQRMFVASTLKSVILCERLRQLDSANIGEKIHDHKLALNKSVWSPGSDIFNPPNLSGLVSERTAMEAMIIHSDNTATDIILKLATANAVRAFIASIDLKKTMIPDSTRSFGAYLAGAPNYKTITWDELMAIPPGPLAHPFLNDVETFASSPDDLVSFFSRALQGAFFSHHQSLFQFRRILLLGDITSLVPFPIGMSVFGKAGYADVSGAHARSIAGAVYFPNRWVYFSMVLNWDAEQDEDPKTVEAFYRGIHKSMVLLQQRLGD